MLLVKYELKHLLNSFLIPKSILSDIIQLVGFIFVCYVLKSFKHTSLSHTKLCFITVL